MCATFACRARDKCRIVCAMALSHARFCRTFKCPFKPLLANLSCYMMSLQNMSSHECAILLNLLKMRQTNPKRHFVEHLMCHLLPTNFIKPVLIFTQQSILILIYNHLYTHLSSINLTQTKNKKSLQYKSSQDYRLL